MLIRDLPGKALFARYSNCEPTNGDEDAVARESREGPRTRRARRPWVHSKKHRTLWSTLLEVSFSNDAGIRAIWECRSEMRGTAKLHPEAAMTGGGGVAGWEPAAESRERTQGGRPARLLRFPNRRSGTSLTE
jgi:hypothetical protein